MIWDKLVSFQCPYFKIRKRFLEKLMLPKTHCFVSNIILSAFPTLITSQSNGVRTTAIPQRKQCVSQTCMCLVLLLLPVGGRLSQYSLGWRKSPVGQAGMAALCLLGAGLTGLQHQTLQTRFLIVTPCSLW